MGRSFRTTNYIQSAAARLRSWKQRMFSTTEVCIYRLPLTTLVTTDWDATEMSTNNWDHLRAYDEKCGWLTREEFLAQAQDRIDKSEQVQTILRNDLLAHYGWLVAPANCRSVSEVGAVVELPTDSAYAYDFFTHPSFRNTGLYQKSLRQMIVRLNNGGAIHDFYIGVVSDNGSSRRVIEKIGFSHVCSFLQRSRWGKIRRWHTEVDGPNESKVICVQEDNIDSSQPQLPQACFRIAASQ